MSKYQIGSQEDAHEFFMDYVEAMHEETKVKKEAKTPSSSDRNNSPKNALFAKGGLNINNSNNDDPDISENDPHLEWILKSAKDSQWNTYLAKERSISTEVFYGLQELKIQCLECNSSSESIEPFK